MISLTTISSVLTQIEFIFDRFVVDLLEMGVQFAGQLQTVENRTFVSSEILIPKQSVFANPRCIRCFEIREEVITIPVICTANTFKYCFFIVLPPFVLSQNPLFKGLYREGELFRRCQRYQ